jgi:phage-related protein
VAGPSVAVRVLADVTAFTKSIGGIAAAGAESAGHMRAAFSGVLGALNQTGVLGPFGAALDGVSAALDAMGKHGKDVGLAMIGVGGALAGIGAGLSAVGSKDQAAHRQLQDAVQATGRDYDDYAKKVEEAVKHQEHFGNTAAETQDALRILTQATGDPTKALKYLGEASDLAAAKHESLGEAATSLGKVYNGAGRVLKEFGVSMDTVKTGSAQLATAQKGVETATEAAAKAHQHLSDVQTALAGKTHLTQAEQIRLRDATQNVQTADEKLREAHGKLTDAQNAGARAAAAHGAALDTLAGKLKGQASAQASTFSGHLREIKARLEDTAASIGQKYGPAITAVGSGMAVMGGAITGARAAVTFLKDSEVVGTAAKIAYAAATFLVNGAMTVATAIWTAFTVVEWASLAPILLIIAGVALLGLAIYELVAHWSTVWAFIKRIIVDVWTWIKEHWPLLLAILLGPIGLAADLIIKNWKSIKKGAEEAVDGIITAWNAIVGFFVGLGSAIARIASTIWKALVDFAKAAVRDVKTAWQAVVDFFVGLYTWLAGVASTIWHALVSFARTEKDAVVNIWHGIYDFFTGLYSWVAGVASTIWHALTSFAQTEKDGIVRIWNDLWSFISGLPDKIAGVGSRMWQGITSGFNDAIGAIKSIWNSTLGNVHVHIPGTNVDIGFPTLQQGGLVTETGLILAHAGEVVAPLDKVEGVGRAGPAVVIETVNLHDGADIELLLQQIRFATLAGKL